MASFTQTQYIAIVYDCFLLIILQAPEGIDKQTMFCNMADVIRVSQYLLTRLEALRSVEFDQQIVGKLSTWNNFKWLFNKYQTIFMVYHSHQSNAEVADIALLFI